MIMQDFEIFDAMPIVFAIKVTYLEGFGHQKVQKDYCAAVILRTSNMIMQDSEIFDAIQVVFAVKVTYLEGFGHQKVQTEHEQSFYSCCHLIITATVD
jgi:hypothetical protein